MGRQIVYYYLLWVANYRTLRTTGVDDVEQLLDNIVFDLIVFEKVVFARYFYNDQISLILRILCFFAALPSISEHDHETTKFPVLLLSGR